MSVYECVPRVWGFQQRPEENINCSGAGITVGCKLFSVGVGN